MADRRFSNQYPHRHRLLMGVGLDSDGHARVTKGEDYVVLGGSKATHERLQEGVERFRDTLQKMGTDLQTASDDEMFEAASESGLIDDA